MGLLSVKLLAPWPVLAGFTVRGDRWRTEGDPAGFLGFFRLLYLAYVAASPPHTNAESNWIGDPCFFLLADVEVSFRPSSPH